MCAEISDGGSPDDNPFGPEKAALELEVPSVPAEFAGRGNHAVARHVALPAVAHDIADRSRCSGAAGSLGDVAVGRNLADRDPPDDGEDATGERGHECSRLPVGRLPLESFQPDLVRASREVCRAVAPEARRRTRTANRIRKRIECRRLPARLRPSSKAFARLPVPDRRRRACSGPCRRRQRNGRTSRSRPRPR